MRSETVEFLKKVLEGVFEVEVKEVKAQKKSGVIYLPMRYINKRAVLIFKNED